VVLNKFVSVTGATLASMVLLGFGYAVAANYGVGALAGIYVLHRDAERCTLHLWSDRTFTEELVRSGNVQKAQATWYRYGESHVSFSPEFLTISGPKSECRWRSARGVRQDSRIPTLPDACTPHRTAPGFGRS
jgi:hypothetical protein